VEKILRWPYYKTMASTLGNMTTCDGADKGLLCVFEHIQLSLCLFSTSRDFKMLEEYLNLLKVKIIIIKKYSYLFLIT